MEKWTNRGPIGNQLTYSMYCGGSNFISTYVHSTHFILFATSVTACWTHQFYLHCSSLMFLRVIWRTLLSRLPSWHTTRGFTCSGIMPSTSYIHSIVSVNLETYFTRRLMNSTEKTSTYISYLLNRLSTTSRKMKNSSDCQDPMWITIYALQPPNSDTFRPIHTRVSEWKKMLHFHLPSQDFNYISTRQSSTSFAKSVT